MSRAVLPFLTIALFLFFSPSESQARTCELKDDGQKFTFFFKVDGGSTRPPTMKEVFDGMNTEDSTLFEDLKFDDEKQSQALVYLQNDSNSPLYPINWPTKPSEEKGDGPCPKNMTGYDCRVKQLKNRKTAELGTMPAGIQTSVLIKVPSGNKALVRQIGKGLGCEPLLYANGQSFDAPAATAKGKRLAIPVGGSSTAP